MGTDEADRDPGQVTGSVAGDALSLAAARLHAGEPVALATVMETWGSAPVPVGGRLAIFADGTFEGAVSGGCIDGEVITAAEDALLDGRTRALAYGVDDATARSAGLPCGGRIRILLEPLQGANDALYASRLVEERRKRRHVVVAIRLGDGVRALYVEGEDIPDPFAETVARGASAIVTDAHGETFVHVLRPAPRVVIVGATQMAQSLVALARTVGYDAVVVDPRTAFATPRRFPATRLYPEWPQDALPAIGLDSRTAVAVLAHTDHIDDAALITALRSGAGYVGALGSRRNHARRIDRLRKAGLDEGLIARIRAPIGLAIGAKTPAEIALSVIAEIVAVLGGNEAA